MRRLRWSAVVPLLLLLATPAVAQEPVPTTVVVRAVSNDAKLIQDPVGGARITIEHARTGAVLAEGRQTGDSGSTDKIIRQAHERGATIYDVPGAAQYETTLALTEPTRVRVTAEGPLDYPQATQTASKTVLLVPGEDVRGDGITLTLHGFIVEMLEPSEAVLPSGSELSVRARVRMLCGCPTEPGGMWDANGYTIRAQLLRDGAVVAEGPLSFAGTTNEYAGTVPVPDGGATRLRVMAQDADRVNFGSVTMSLTRE
ncbi:hypothetical protein [Salinibacter grassmerensis]|uniref:hypothetical protein n=1 Tax=Salinibacter grassmerensis TaxID=3040353 RepID=UPI0021E6FB31|nr:hypothetical protein [Salinibacter grassmerensis]